MSAVCQQDSTDEECPSQEKCLTDFQIKAVTLLFKADCQTKNGKRRLIMYGYYDETNETPTVKIKD